MLLSNKSSYPTEKGRKAYQKATDIKRKSGDKSLNLITAFLCCQSHYNVDQPYRQSYL